MNSHLEMTSWRRPDTRIRVVRVAGPPSTTAVMQNGMEKAAVNIGRTAPDPTGPIRRTCTNVERPTAISEAKTIQVKYEPSIPDALATTTGVTSRLAEAKKLN